MMMDGINYLFICNACIMLYTVKYGNSGYDDVA